MHIFTQKLLDWFEHNDRPLPWKGEKNPYYIWLSEIILQQTRVAQGLPYFERFKAQYPTIKELADAPADEVMKLWEGLGYYSRARNLHFTAKTIAYELDGQFPSTYEEILQLKGVGPYTAAAIASFAFDLPTAVVDGNVYRVLSRVFGIKTPIDTTIGKKEFSALADQLIAKEQPAVYNQAIMDFGATQCTPAKPNCTICPMNDVCVAKEQGWVADLPIKSKKIKKRDRYFNFLVVKNADQATYIQKRTEKDIWQNLYQFPLIETTQLLEDWTELTTQQAPFDWTQLSFVKQSKPYKQQLTHQQIFAKFWEISTSTLDQLNLSSGQWVSNQERSEYAFPKIIDAYLKDKTLYLELF